MPQPVAWVRCRSSQRAVRNKRPSSRRGPTSCTPIGRPLASSKGKDTAGTPVQYGVTRFVGDLVKLVVAGSDDGAEIGTEV